MLKVFVDDIHKRQQSFKQLFMGQEYIKKQKTTYLNNCRVLKAARSFGWLTNG